MLIVIFIPFQNQQVSKGANDPIGGHDYGPPSSPTGTTVIAKATAEVIIKNIIINIFQGGVAGGGVHKPTATSSLLLLDTAK